METLAQYLRIDGVEWGVLDTGLNLPSGIALNGDTCLCLNMAVE